MLADLGAAALGVVVGWLVAMPAAGATSGRLLRGLAAPLAAAPLAAQLGPAPLEIVSGGALGGLAIHLVCRWALGRRAARRGG